MSQVFFPPLVLYRFVFWLVQGENSSSVVWIEKDFGRNLYEKGIYILSHWKSSSMQRFEVIEQDKKQLLLADSLAKKKYNFANCFVDNILFLISLLIFCCFGRKGRTYCPLPSHLFCQILVLSSWCYLLGQVFLNLVFLLVLQKNSLEGELYVEYTYQRENKASLKIPVSRLAQNRTFKTMLANVKVWIQVQHSSYSMKWLLYCE